MLEEQPNDPRLSELLRDAAVRVTDSRAAQVSDVLSSWAESRATGLRTRRNRVVALVAVGVALATGSGVAAAALGVGFPHNGRQPDAHWVYQATNGQTCDLWTRIEPDRQRGATEADGAAYLRGHLSTIDIASIDLSDALREWEPAPGASIGQSEGMALVMYVHRHLLPGVLPDGRTPDVTIESWVDCDEAPR